MLTERFVFVVVQMLTCHYIFIHVLWCHESSEYRINHNKVDIQRNLLQVLTFNSFLKQGNALVQNGIQTKLYRHSECE